MKNIHTSSVDTGKELLGKAMKALNFGGRIAAQMAGTNAMTIADREKMRSSVVGKNIIESVNAMQKGIDRANKKVSAFLPLAKFLKKK